MGFMAGSPSYTSRPAAHTRAWTGVTIVMNVMAVLRATEAITRCANDRPIYVNACRTNSVTAGTCTGTCVAADNCGKQLRQPRLHGRLVLVHIKACKTKGMPLMCYENVTCQQLTVSQPRLHCGLVLVHIQACSDKKCKARHGRDVLLYVASHKQKTVQVASMGTPTHIPGALCMLNGSTVGQDRVTCGHSLAGRGRVSLLAVLRKCCCFHNSAYSTPVGGSRQASL
jgi:hypothetical protein